MDSYEKFQELLKKLFQFDASDLDFGIYRILNYKRDKVEKFITNDLRKKVDESFKKHKGERFDAVKNKLEEAKKNVIENLGKNAFKPSGDLKEEFKDTPKGKEFLLAKSQNLEIEKLEEIHSQVFNDLYNFFSLYYQDGDFVPQYRYSIKNHKYAIPYNGEEVKLYWANQNQYYIKTGILFRDYTFNTDILKVIFRIAEAEEELGSNKATKERFFILDNENPLDKSEDSLIITFQYRELTNPEVSKYDAGGGSSPSKQEKINQKSFVNIVELIKDIKIKGALSKLKNENPLLLHHLDRFAAKNSRDYFIHKNLKKFLSEQLDYYIKSEVISIDTIENEQFVDKHITRAKVVREIAADIIDFLSQIEDFQKKLWEKIKFVLKTEYVITTDRISEEFYDEIFKNKEQRKEWKELRFEIPGKSNDLNNYFLPVDTKYFNLKFKEEILESVTIENNLDDFLNGLLIKSENWQALNLLLNKYKEKVQTIYIDPPFNLGTNADFLYNVNYKDSTWISLLENRFYIAYKLLQNEGHIFVRCDYNGNIFVKTLLENTFGQNNFKNELIINKSNKQGAIDKRFNPALESLFLFSKKETNLINPQYKKRDKEPEWLDMHSPKENTDSHTVIINNETFVTPKTRHWTFSQDTVNQLNENKRIRIITKEYVDVFGKKRNRMPQYLMSEYETIDSNWTDISGYSSTQNFKTENSEALLKRVISSTSNNYDLVLDYFLGSATTTAVGQKLNRKWIGIEIGNHFNYTIIRRMKNILNFDSGGISKEKDVKNIYNKKIAGGFFKYQILEQYEDVLDNLELKENKDAEELFKDEYLLKYFIDFETKENNSLLNIDKLKTPFEYKIKVNFEEVGEPEETVVDIPETFNYLLGLKVNKFKSRFLKKNKYYFILGEKDNKDTAIVWRNYGDDWKDKEFKDDKEFILNELKDWNPHIIYVNGNSVLTTKFFDRTVEIRYIEPEFKKLMF